MSQLFFRITSLFIVLISFHAEARWVPGNLLNRIRNRSHATEPGTRQPIGAPRELAPVTPVAPPAPVTPSPFIQVSEIKTIADTKTDPQLPKEKGMTDYIVCRWFGDELQYQGGDGHWYYPLNVNLPEGAGRFANQQGSTVSYNDGDITFEIDGLGWFKAKASTPKVDDPRNKYMRNPDHVALTEMEREVIVQTNFEREKRGYPLLTVSPRLMRTAREKSTNMALFNNMSHYGVNPLPPKDSYENIARFYQTATAVMTTWMNSSGHRANILRPETLYIGVSTDSTSGREPFHTQLFSRNE